MTKKYIMLSLNDEKSKQISEILASSKAKEMLDILSEKEVSETDLATQLNLPVNTIEYHLKKLLEVGLIEKTKTFFWSIKGKKIPTYKAADKTIVITPKPRSSIKLAFMTIAISTVAAFFIKFYYSIKEKAFQSQLANNVSIAIEETAKESENMIRDELLTNAGKSTEGATSGAGSAPETIQKIAENLSENLTSNLPSLNFYQQPMTPSNIWLWFLIGAAFSLLVFFTLKKILKSQQI